MNTINRGLGTTDSERYLAKLADRTFLDLWSYPNVYRAPGKELCDLLVVCGDYVLVFSDKEIAWPGDVNVALSWRRWFSRAIQSSTAQIRGAERWLTRWPEKIFLDAQATRQLPLQIPAVDRRKVHGIVVARGIRDASINHFKGGLGSLLVVSDLKGDDHMRESSLRPFAIGDVDPDGPFVHVFDEVALEVAMSELDTITDFAEYLEKKASAIRSGRLLGAQGEEDLVAYFMTHMNTSGEHDFAKPDGSDWRDGERLLVEAGTFAHMRSHPQYRAKKIADRDSYIWDRLIETFTKHMLAGTTMVPDGGEFQLGIYEQGVRHMALVSRFGRRNLGSALTEALEKGRQSPGRESPRFARALFPGTKERKDDTGFFVMTLAVPKHELADGYQQYRQVRLRMLEVYALHFLRKFPELRRIVGVGMEPLGSEKSSEDLIYAEAPREWTTDLIRDLEERQQHYDIARPERVREFALGGKEFPDVVPAPEEMPSPMRPNRKQRRIMKAKARRKPK